jgi:hypothetical protein
MPNPALADARREEFVRELMSARRAVGAGMRNGDPAAVANARGDVDRAKRLLGERGPVWWSDGEADLNRKKVRSTPYAAWYEALAVQGTES